MVAIYVPANNRGTGRDIVCCYLPLDCVTILSHGVSRGDNLNNFPSASVWMVPGTYED
jgi:hypothetical protein